MPRCRSRRSPPPICTRTRLPRARDEGAADAGVTAEAAEAPGPARPPSRIIARRPALEAREPMAELAACAARGPGAGECAAAAEGGRRGGTSRRARPAVRGGGGVNAVGQGTAKARDEGKTDRDHAQDGAAEGRARPQ